MWWKVFYLLIVLQWCVGVKVSDILQEADEEDLVSEENVGEEERRQATWRFNDEANKWVMATEQGERVLLYLAEKTKECEQQDSIYHSCMGVAHKPLGWKRDAEWRTVSEETTSLFSMNHQASSHDRLTRLATHDLTSSDTKTFLSDSTKWVGKETLVYNTQVNKTIQTEQAFRNAFDQSLNLSPFMLASLGSESLIIVLPPETKGKNRNVVVERFFNTKSWVYVRHSTQPDIDIAGLFTFRGRFYATTTDGRLLERRLTTERKLEWKVHSEPRAFGPARVSGKRNARSVFFLSEQGELLERKGLPPASMTVEGEDEKEFSWVTYETQSAERPTFLERPVVIADAESLQPNLLYFIGENGNLLEGSLDKRLNTMHLSNLGHPDGMPFSPVQAFVLRKSSMSRTKALFLVTLTGDLVEFAVDSFQSEYQWIIHGHPAPQEYILVPVGPHPEPRSILALTSKGRVVERHIFGSNWVWIHHGAPSTTTIPSSEDTAQKSSTSDVVRKDSENPVAQESLRDNRGTSDDDGEASHDEIFKDTITLAQVSGVSLSSNTAFFMADRHTAHDGTVVAPMLAARVWNGEDWEWESFALPEVGTASYCVADTDSPHSCTRVAQPKGPTQEDDTSV